MDLEEIISNQHKYLITFFDRDILTCRDHQSWSEFLQKCQTLFEGIHHHNEEIFLFSAVRNHPRLREGGPFCTLYFDQHLANPSLQKAQHVIKKVLGQEIIPQWSKELQSDRALNLPLVIPGEDHEAGRLLLIAAQKVLKLPFCADVQNSLKMLFETYREIQVFHFEREEKCFLKMCKALLSSEQWRNVALDFKKNSGLEFS